MINQYFSLKCQSKFILLFLCTFFLHSAEKGYNTIYLMEFDNLKNDFTNSHLKEALPDLIKENYKFREDIDIEYAGDIRPFLDNEGLNEKDNIKGLIINGSFQTIKDEFYVAFEAYDIHNWKQLVKRQIFCPTNDILCVHDAFLIAIESSISPFLSNQIDLDETIRYLERKEKEIPTLGENDQENLDLDQDLDNSIESRGQYGNRYYREFNLKKIAPSLQSNLEKNTKDLIVMLEQILTGPYDVAIGEMSINIDPIESDIIAAKLPIQYSIRSNLVQEYFNYLPHKKYTTDNNDIIIQLSNEDFIFDEGFMERLSLMEFQMMPVIFFNDKIGKTQFFIIDSWNKKYNKIRANDISMIWEDDFRPLFALTPGAETVQLTIDSDVLEIIYNFKIPYYKMGDYTKVTVKFMKESELEDLLSRQFKEG